MADNERTYLFDCDALVNLNERPDCEAVIQHFVRLVGSGVIKSVPAALNEFERRWPEFYEKIKHLWRVMSVEQYEPPVWSLVGEISERYPQLYKQLSRFNNSADPFLIAAAKVHGFLIVTDESESGPEYTRKIPHISSQYGVETINSPGFLRETSYGQ